MESAANTLSKNALKRQLRRKKFEETRDAWKAKQKEKKRLSREKKKQATDTPSPKPVVNPAPPIGTIIFDLSFEDLMSEKEIASLVSQICRSYAFNRKSSRPYKLKCVGFGGKFKERLQKSFPDYQKWDMEFLESSLEDYIKAGALMNPTYLSADSDSVLEEIEEECVLIVGGLVDRNRHKGAAFKQAERLSISTAKLPIQKYVKLNSSQVLTTLNVIELLCAYRNSNIWLEAIKSAIPNRKINSIIQ